MSRSTKRLRRGSWLTPVDTAQFVSMDDELRDLDARLIGQGFRRTPNMRPYLTKAGVVTMRFCWRKRSAGLTHTHVRVWRLPIEDLER